MGFSKYVNLIRSLNKSRRKNGYSAYPHPYQRLSAILLSRKQVYGKLDHQNMMVKITSIFWLVLTNLCLTACKMIWDDQSRSSDGETTALNVAQLPLPLANRPPKITPLNKPIHTIDEDRETPALKMADFGFADDDTGDSLQAVRIIFVDNGDLLVNGVPIDLDVPQIYQFGQLTIKPDVNFYGDVRFDFQVQDTRGNWSDTATRIVTVRPVNDAPVGSNKNISGKEDIVLIFKASDFTAGVHDVENNLVTHIVVMTLPPQNKGRLTLNGQPVMAGQVLTLEKIAGLVYTPPANKYGSEYTSFTFQLKTGEGEGHLSVPYEMNIAINSQTDALSLLATRNEVGPIDGATRIGSKLPSTSGQLFFSNQDGGKKLSISVGFNDEAQEDNPVQIIKVSPKGHQYIYDGKTSPSSFGTYVGKYGLLEILHKKGNFSDLGWRYETFSGHNSGGSFNRLKSGDKAIETIKFVVSDGERETVKQITLELIGHHDRPFMVKAVPDQESVTEEFPVTESTSKRPWKWWQEDFIEAKDNPLKPETVQIVMDAGKTAVWRFIIIDEDQGYFQPREGQSSKYDYGDVAEFIKNSVVISGHNVNKFEIVHVANGDGTPRFVPMPYNDNLLVPVLEIHFKSAADATPLGSHIIYDIRLTVKDAELDSTFQGFEIDLKIIVEDRLKISSQNVDTVSTDASLLDDDSVSDQMVPILGDNFMNAEMAVIL